MIVGDKQFGVVSYVIMGVFSPRKCLYFSTPMTAFRVFSETDFWIYSVNYTVDRLNLHEYLHGMFI